MLEKVDKKTDITNLLNPNSFVDMFRNNFIDSKNNTQAFKNFNDIRVKSNDNIIQFGDREIEKTTRSLNKFQACDCNGLTLDNIMRAHRVIYVSLKKLFNVMLLPEAFVHI